MTAVGTGSACQRVTYVFDVKARITNVVDVQRKTFQVQVIEATSLGNEKGAPSQLFNDGRAAATAEFRSKVIGSTQVKTAAQLGLALVWAPVDWYCYLLFWVSGYWLLRVLAYESA